MSPSGIKNVGYLISMLSVVLLGIVSWNSAKSNPVLAATLLAGMATSVAGMAMRW